jgi:metal-responsive CopG/Arc/MetJ family transcriptional regulator
MRKVQHPSKQACQRIIVSLPRPLVGAIRQYSRLFRRGNKSGFVADAVRNYIDYLRRSHHTAKLRAAYAASAEESLRIGQPWEMLADEVWLKLDRLEPKGQ